MDLTKVHQGCKSASLRSASAAASARGKARPAAAAPRASSPAPAPIAWHYLRWRPDAILPARPKRGFTNGTYAKHYNVVNLGDIDEAFADGDEVTPETLKEKGLAKKPSDGVRILGDGDLTKKLTFRAHGFSKSALAKIEAKGGKADVHSAPKKPVRNKMKPPPAQELPERMRWTRACE